MKKKVIFIIISIVLILVIIFVTILIKHEIEVTEYCNKETLYGRLNFDIPEDIQVKELYYNINEETMRGEQNERLDLALTINEDEINKFIELIEKSEYAFCDWIKEDYSVITKPNNVDEKDIGNSKLNSLYNYCFTRKADNWNVRCKVYIYIYEQEENNESYNVYISYIG